MPDKDRTNPPFPVVNVLTLEGSLVRTTQLIFINYCQDNLPSVSLETGADRKTPHLSLRVSGSGAGKRRQNSEQSTSPWVDD